MSAQPALGLAPAPRPALALVRDEPPPALSLIEPLPDGLKTYPTLEALAARCAQLLAGRPLRLTLATGSYAPFATAPLQSVWAEATPTSARLWLAAAVLGGDPLADQARLAEAIAAQIHNRRN